MLLSNQCKCNNCTSLVWIV